MSYQPPRLPQDWSPKRQADHIYNGLKMAIELEDWHAVTLCAIDLNYMSMKWGKLSALENVDEKEISKS